MFSILFIMNNKNKNNLIQKDPSLTFKLRIYLSINLLSGISETYDTLKLIVNIPIYFQISNLH